MTRRLSAAYTFFHQIGTNTITRIVIHRRNVHYLFNYGSINFMPLKRKYYTALEVASFHPFLARFNDQQISSQK